MAGKVSHRSSSRPGKPTKPTTTASLPPTKAPTGVKQATGGPKLQNEVAAFVRGLNIKPGMADGRDATPVKSAAKHSGKKFDQPTAAKKAFTKVHPGQGVSAKGPGKKFDRPVPGKKFDRPVPGKQDPAKRVSQKPQSKPDNYRIPAPQEIRPCATPTLDPRFNSRGVDDKKFLIPPSRQWYVHPGIELSVDAEVATLDANAIAGRLQQAKQLYEEEITLFRTRPSISKSDRQFLSTVMDSGTTTDRISALTLLCQESPFHVLATLKQLLDVVGKNSRRETHMMLTSVKDLFTINLLPERKLRFFVDQPLGHPDIGPAQLVLWYFEDQLKRLYFSLIQAFEVATYDTVSEVKRRAITDVYDLLVAKPEQEQNLLRLLVNKLGDKDRTACSKASYLLLKLMQTFPNMNAVVVQAAEELIMRNRVGDRALYNAITTINQTVLQEGNFETANRLVAIYFHLFHQILSPTVEEPAPAPAPAPAPKKPEPLHPANGSRPVKKFKKPRWRNMEDEGAAKRAERDERRQVPVHVSQAKLAAQKKEIKEESDRLMAEHGRLVAAVLTGVNRAIRYSNIDDSVFNNYIQTIFRLVHVDNFNAVVQALMLLYQVVNLKPDLIDRYFRALYASLLDHRLINTSKHVLYLNLLNKSLQFDTSRPRTMSFIKRIVQIAAYHQPPFVCGLFFVLLRLMKNRPELQGLIRQAEDHDEEERFVDVASDGEEVPVPATATASVVSTPYYEALKREPLYTGAERSCLWEILPFATHYHPTVAMYAVRLIRCMYSNELPPNMHNFALTNFLDRFVFRNPKKAPITQRGISTMQPFVAEDALHSAKADYISGKRAFVMPEGLQAARSGTGTDGSSRLLAAEPVEDHYLHAYLQVRRKRQPTKPRRGAEADEDAGLDAAEDRLAGYGADDQMAKALANKHGEDSDEFSDEDDEEQAEILQAMEKSLPAGLRQALDGDIDSDPEFDDEDFPFGNEDDEDDEEDVESGSDEEDEEANIEGDSDEEDDSEDDEASDREEADKGESLDDMLKAAGFSAAADGEATSDKASKGMKRSKESEAAGKTPKETSRSKRQRLANLPAFASYEDYASLLDKDD
ncbi:RNA-binding ribosome biosynthesis protein mak21 [Tieghemiomyces parasiticus]|uniref:RNA-binding ribosome biosynthesis protein mak21 n=1 Tax=Tieghemiomyces parasiticus TaxID=78921 RepID=A0A9W8AFT5_9FUNG|nr:RNA-binding ribosome biosynthesis protein mak21 [Tieghemiomyces parasiticus]